MSIWDNISDLLKIGTGIAGSKRPTSDLTYGRNRDTRTNTDIGTNTATDRRLRGTDTTFNQLTGRRDTGGRDRTTGRVTGRRDTGGRDLTTGQVTGRRDRSGATTQRNRVAPWEPAVDPLTRLLGSAEQTYLAGQNIPFQENPLLQSYMDQSAQGIDLSGVQNIIDRKGYENIDQVIDRALAPVERRYTENILPGLETQGSLYNRLTSTTHQDNYKDAMANFAREAGDIATGIAYQDYGDHLDRSLRGQQVLDNLISSNLSRLGSGMAAYGQYGYDPWKEHQKQLANQAAYKGIFAGLPFQTDTTGTDTGFDTNVQDTLSDTRRTGFDTNVQDTLSDTRRTGYDTNVQDILTGRKYSSIEGERQRQLQKQRQAQLMKEAGFEKNRPEWTLQDRMGGFNYGTSVLDKLFGWI